ncbi:MAG: Nif3-like dinuclear metal center hexameric protein [Spirochaetes bacterium]|nr:Nif3-like dinuclear metal center hexameric protein [Spirochaetota bacterium]
MANRDEIVRFLDERLDVRRIKDKSSNGLQVAGKNEVTRIAVATDAAMATYKRAAAEGCDMVIVHHGLIWGGIQHVTHRNREHLKFLLERDINLYAAHLPLDMHPQIGNNALLAMQLGLEQRQPFGNYHGENIGISGKLTAPLSAQEIADRFAAHLGGVPRIMGFGPKENRAVAIISGGGGSVFDEVIESGFDCFITGEVSHEIFHSALEGRVNVILLGHYLSETVGVRALGQETAARFGIPMVFIDEPTGF